MLNFHCSKLNELLTCKQKEENNTNINMQFRLYRECTNRRSSSHQATPFVRSATVHTQKISKCIINAPYCSGEKVEGTTSDVPNVNWKVDGTLGLLCYLGILRVVYEERMRGGNEKQFLSESRLKKGACIKYLLESLLRSFWLCILFFIAGHREA